jgi:hypothetical protein
MADETESDSSLSALETVATALMVAALVVREVVSRFYEGFQRHVPDALPILSPLFLCLSIIAWFSIYCQKHHIPWVLDMGWFLFGAWCVFR